MNWEALIDDFLQVAHLSGIVLSPDMLTIETLPPRTRAGSLPKNRIAVYIFFWNDQCLKVGKAGPNSNARYFSQHYNPKSSKSNLAKSILKDRDNLGLVYLTEATVGDWIIENTTRTNILVDKAVGIPVLSLLESYLQCRLNPGLRALKARSDSDGTVIILSMFTLAIGICDPCRTGWCKHSPFLLRGR